MTRAEDALDALKQHGYRMTPQRRAIVFEIMRTRGHISPQKIVDRVGKRLPGTNPSTVYRTLELLEDLGIVSHSHLGNGPEYHKADEHDHVHLICSRCNRAESLSEGDTAPLKKAISRHSGFVPDFTHFAISGLCADCRKRG